MEVYRYEDIKEKMIPLDFSCQKWISEVDLCNKVKTVDAIPIPHEATNEDILKAVFPNDADDIIKYIKIFILNGWLNAKYEGLEDGKIDCN